jgi:predicted AAA+ superfamily ATPase
MRQASETLAGRVDYVDLSPIDALELPKLVGDVNRLWIRGGFPESLLAPDDVTSLNWRRSNLARDVLKPRVSHLVHGGSEAWPMAEGVTAIALVDLMRKLVKSRPRP